MEDNENLLRAMLEKNNNETNDYGQETFYYDSSMMDVPSDSGSSARVNESFGLVRRMLKYGKRLIVGLITAATITTMAGCGLLNDGDTDNTDDTYGVTDSDEKNNGSDSGSGSGNGDTDSTKENDYSDIFNAILTKSKYLTANNNFDAFHTGDKWSYDSQVYESVPYGFEDTDFESDRIYNNELEADSIAYTKDDDTNHLYISLKAENDDASQPYYTFYTLKYSITDKEYEELNSLHGYNSLLYPFFIQELSEQKTATVESKAKMTVAVYESMLNYFKVTDEYSTDVFGDTKIDFDFTDFNITSDDGDLTVKIYGRYITSEPFESTSREITLHQINNFDACRFKALTDNTSVYRSPANNFTFSDEEYQYFISDENAETRTIYLTQTNMSQYNASSWLSVDDYSLI